jgi:hypothetical protein
MKNHNPQNERIKRAYFTYLTEARGFSEEKCAPCRRQPHPIGARRCQ